MQEGRINAVLMCDGPSHLSDPDSSWLSFVRCFTLKIELHLKASLRVQNIFSGALLFLVLTLPLKVGHLCFEVVRWSGT